MQLWNSMEINEIPLQKFNRSSRIKTIAAIVSMLAGGISILAYFGVLFKPEKQLVNEQGLQKIQVEESESLRSKEDKIRAAIQEDTATFLQYTKSQGDSDGDGLSDIDEKKYGTDAEKEDSDSDFLSDFQEIFETKTNPLKWDSDGDGIGDYNDVPVLKATSTPS